MSRDSKLAVIVGFVVLLVVTTLLSDHFSRARTDRIEHGDHVGAPVPIEVPAIALRPVPQPPTGTRTTARGGQGSSDVSPEALLTREGRRGGHGDNSGSGIEHGEPLVITMTPPDGTGGTGGTGVDRDLGVDLSRTGSSLADRLRQLAEAAGAPLENVPMMLARPEDTDEAGTGLVQQRRKAGGDAVSETVGTYIVQKGDSLSKIAAEVLGSAGRWREIAARNTDRVSPNGNVQVGVMLRIPGTTAGNLNAGGSNTTTRGTEARDPVGERTYTVKGGDTLSEIAAEQLGSARRVRELLKLNSGRIKDADDIRVGMNLMLPAR